MTLKDWVDNSKDRIREKPTHIGIAESAFELYDGAKNRIKWEIYQTYHGSGGFNRQTDFAGAEVSYHVKTWEDLRRADDGLREGSLMDWLFEWVDDETVFWDIGGFHGTYSIVAGKLGAETHVFEPHPENRKRLTKNIEINNLDITVNPIGLSDTNATLRFTDPGRNAEFRIDPHGTLEIETKRGDDINTQPDIVKLDVEGHECEVLDGMKETLTAVDRILVEVHEGVRKEEVSTRLTEAGLTPIELETKRSQTYIGGIR